MLETEAKLAVQELIRRGTLQLVRSYMMDFENDANPFEDRRISISIWRGLAAVDISASQEVLSRARRIHLSCAIDAGSSIFFTTDTGILKKADLISDLGLINPVDYEFNKP